MKARGFIAKLKRGLLILGLTAVLAVAVLGIVQRRALMARGYALVSPKPELLTASPEKEGVRFFDDYFTVEEIATDCVDAPVVEASIKAARTEARNADDAPVHSGIL